MDKITTSGSSRVWLLENGPAPFNIPAYMGLMRIGETTWAAGDVTPIRIPDPSKYNAFVIAGKVRSGEENATVSISGRYPEQASTLLKLRRALCRVDIHVPIGKCGDPQDYLRGWEKLRIYRDGEITSWADENAGALDSDENNPINESGEFSVQEVYEVTKISFEEVAASEAAREIIDISVCDAGDCGECGSPSDGCQNVFAAMLGAGATPGTQPSVLYSDDGGATWGVTTIDTLFSNETLTGGACVGIYYVILCSTSLSHHYAESQNILDGVEVWKEVNTGYVAGGEPNAISSLDSRHTWIVGNGGYVYFSADITASVSVQDAGVATAQNLVSIHAYNSQYAIAGGALNALIYTSNGGESWQALTGPAVGETLRAVYMLSETVWLIGTNTGKLYYTKNSGTTFTLISLPGSVDNIDAIDFFDDTVGVIACRQGTRGYWLQTTDGGNSWIILPRDYKDKAIPANDYFNDIEVCGLNPNVVFGAGLADDATTGIIVKAS